MTNATINTVETINDAMDFCKSWLEIATGREFETVHDNASVCEDDKGNAFSYLLELGSGNASTRFQVWITARKRGGARVDLFIGNAYIETETVNIDSLATYRKGNDCGQGNTYRSVPMDTVKAFFESNELVRKTTKAKSNAKAV